MTVEELGNNSVDILGLLINVSGPDSALTGTVLLQAADVTVKGTSTGGSDVINATNRGMGRGVKGNSDHEVVVNAAVGGFGQVIGGTNENLRMSFSSVLYRT